MKSLVGEIAAKHDEIGELKSQINALDEVVHTARQKLLLKDQCIAQLNQQVRYPIVALLNQKSAYVHCVLMEGIYSIRCFKNKKQKHHRRQVTLLIIELSLIIDSLEYFSYRLIGCLSVQSKT